MKHIPSTLITRKCAILAAAAVAMLLGSCASTTNTPPPPGFAVIDAKPDPEHRERVAGIALVSINGKKVHGTRSAIAPGLNTIKTRFRWPQGQDQQVDLRFYATPGTVYFMHYDVFPHAGDLEKSLVSGRASGAVFDSLSEGGDPMGAMIGTLLLAPPLAVAGVVERVGRTAARSGASATHIDLMVIARHSSQGIVRKLRAYPDGRIDANTWSAGAQMQAP